MTLYKSFVIEKGETKAQIIISEDKPKLAPSSFFIFSFRFFTLKKNPFTKANKAIFH